MEDRLSDLSTLILVLSRDPALVEQLPVALTRLDEDVEAQVVDSPKKLLAVLSGTRPDAVVIDVATLDAITLPELLQSKQLANVAAIVVDEPDDEDHKDWALRLGIADYVPRKSGYIQPLSHTAFVTGRISKLDGEIEQTEKHYRDVLDSLSDGVFVLMRGKLRYVNEAFARFVGHGTHELLRREVLRDLVPEKYRADVESRLAAVEGEHGARDTFDLKLTSKDGAVASYKLSCHNSVLHGMRAVVGVARDITATRKLQAELERTRKRAAEVERLRALGELAAGVVHDFNNALGTIVGRVTLAQEKLAKGAATIGDELQVILTACGHASDTVARVRRLTRPAGSDSWEDVDLRAVISEAATLVQTHLPAGASLKTRLQATPSVRGNPDELLDVLHNLLRNAADAVEEGGHVQASCEERDGRAAVVVEDDGNGLDAETKERIFEPFYTTKGDSGTGLGLSVSHWILRRHDARIDVDSAPGRGTRVTVSFTPLSPGPPHVTKRISSDVLTILVVDDDATVADMMNDMLTCQGYDVTVVRSATAAAAQLANHPTDVVLTDLNLPDMSGWELARLARQAHGGILVGLVTGWPLGATEEELKGRGVDFVLGKPFSMEALSRAVAKARG